MNRLIRWSLFPQYFDFKISYIPGGYNIADCFTRYINKVTRVCLSEGKILAIISEYHRESGLVRRIT